MRLPCRASVLAGFGPAPGSLGSPFHLGGRFGPGLGTGSARGIACGPRRLNDRRFGPEFLFGLGPVPLGTAFGAALALPERMSPSPHPVLPIRIHDVPLQAAFWACSSATSTSVV